MPDPLVVSFAQIMKRPFFSCVIPVKGARPYMDEALESLKIQGMGDNLEVIIQDGDVEADSGQSDALNKGFSKAHGEWLFWLNADDVLLPGALRKVKDYIGRVECIGRIEWIAGNTIYIDKDDKVIEVRCDARWRPWFGKHMSVWTGGPSACFRSELWQNHGGFDTNLRYVMDLDVWIRWAQAGIRFKGVNEYLWGFRVHEGSATYKSSNRRDIDREFQEVLYRLNIRNEQFWRNVTRVASIFDGTRWQKVRDTIRFKGRDLIDCVGCTE